MSYPLPSHLILEITRHCNYHCPFCYCVWHEFPELASRDLPMRSWERIIDRILERGVNDLLFTGGEALLRKDVLKLVEYARRRSPECRLALFTNGSRMTEATLKFCKTHRVRLCTSLPGLRTYGTMTGTRRSCFPILEMLTRAKELDWPFEVSLTATKVNASEFVDMFCAAALVGASSIQAGAMMLEGRARSRTDLVLTPAEWNNIKAQIRALPDCRTSYQFSDEILCECREQPPDYSEIYGNPAAEPCPAGHAFGVIGPSGKFRQCLHTIINHEW